MRRSNPESAAGSVLTDAYRHRTRRPGYAPDPCQESALAELERLRAELTSTPARRRRWWHRLGAGRTPAPIRGVYLWGGVGRGKTFLMDLFCDSLAVPHRREHFHRFMLEVHAGLRDLRHRQDPLVPIAAGIADRARVLCLDELFVADIGDAMVLAGLIRALIGHGVSLVTTSNTRPADLYRGGLQRDRFMPAIDLIEERTAVVHMDGPTDYRLRRLDHAPVFLVPDDAEAGRRLDSLFREMAGDGDDGDGEVLVHGRPIAVRHAAEGMLWFDFDELCRGHRSKLDYVEIARLCHTVFVSGIPVLTAVDDDAARRFIELVDVLYDRCVNVVASAAAEPEALYTGTRMARGFARAASRLHEFRSHAYQARPHRP